jgi:Uma2 family endonuclease
MNAVQFERAIEYPTSDGQPMAETLYHQTVMIDLILGLRRRYADAPDIWVGGNFFLCYEEGNPRAHMSPDVVVAKGIRKAKKRPNYLLWEEKPPSLVVEVTSRSTRDEDLGRKKDLYQWMGVEEYVLFDPFGEYLRPPLQGYRLEVGRYRPIRREHDGTLVSRITDLRFKPEGERLRLVDVATGEPLRWPEEVEAAQALAEKRAMEEAAARRAADERATEEAAARRAAEDRATELSAARRAAEDRIRALEEELSRLRADKRG